MPEEERGGASLKDFASPPGVSSVEISRGAKGGYSWTVKCYDPDLSVARRRAEEEEAKLREKFGAAPQEGGK